MSLGIHHIDISLENIPGKLDDVKTKRLVEHSAGNGINGGHTPKINWEELATFIRAAASTDDEEAFLAKIESFVLPTLYSPGSSLKSTLPSKSKSSIPSFKAAFESPLP